MSIPLPPVQSHSAGGLTASPGLVTLTFPSAVAAGDLLVIGVAAAYTSTTTFSVTDSLGNTYLQAGLYVAEGSTVLSVWYTVTGAGGTCTVTATPSPSGSGRTAITGAEYSGAVTTLGAVVDGTSSPGNSSSGAAGATAGSVPVSGTGELVVAFFTQSVSGHSFLGSVGTVEQNATAGPSNLGIVLVDLTNQSAAVTPAGTYSSGSAAWAALGASFFPASPPPPPPPGTPPPPASGGVWRLIETGAEYMFTE
jgi:hypothetical protein